MLSISFSKMITLLCFQAKFMWESISLCLSPVLPFFPHMLYFQGARKYSKKVILDMTIWHPMKRPNKISRNFREIWQVELLQQGRFTWQFSKMLSEGKHRPIQGFHLEKIGCFAVPWTLPICVANIYGLGPKVAPQKRYASCVQSHPHCWGKTATMPPPTTSTITTLIHILPLPSFLGDPGSLPPHPSAHNGKYAWPVSIYWLSFHKMKVIYPFICLFAYSLNIYWIRSCSI